MYRRLITSLTTISLAGVLLLGSGQANAGSASVQQQLGWHAYCITTWVNSWLNKTCPGAGVSHFIVNGKLACTAEWDSARCPDNQGGTLRMYKWENLRSIIPTARYCVLNDGKGKFFQQGSRPSNCQADNW